MVAVILPDEKKGGCRLPFFLWFFLPWACSLSNPVWLKLQEEASPFFLHWKRKSTAEVIEKSARLFEFFRIPSNRLPVAWCRWVSVLKNAYLSSEIGVWRCHVAQRRCVWKRCGCPLAGRASGSCWQGWPGFTFPLIPNSASLMSPALSCCGTWNSLSLCFDGDLWLYYPALAWFCGCFRVIFATAFCWKLGHF